MTATARRSSALDAAALVTVGVSVLIALWLLVVVAAVLLAR